MIGYNFHALRDTFVIRYFGVEMSIGNLNYVLGHASMTITAKRKERVFGNKTRTDNNAAKNYGNGIDWRKAVMLTEKQAQQEKIQHVYIIGAKSLGAYGGYETFVDKLTEYHQNNNRIKYHIACKANGDGCMDETKLEGVKRLNTDEFVYHNAYCFKIHVPEIGAAQAIYYDIKALKKCYKDIKKNNIQNPVIYILACRIGPFAFYFQKKIHKLKGKIYLNPDGHEWMRSKWNKIVRWYWKKSEQMMIKHCDLVICDSKNIQKYIQKTYEKYNPETTYIAYGAEIEKSLIENDNEELINWYKEKGLSKKNYYLAVGRFVPENNYEFMIKEFMKSKSKKSFAIITTTDKVFLDKLEEKLHFKQDSRIKFVGTVYNPKLLQKIREQAYGYLHGHEVGGTNPSLLEALGSTKLNLLLNVGFNKEVAENSALYWNKQKGNLKELINQADCMSEHEIEILGKKAKNRILEAYSWEYISMRYEKCFLRKID